MGSWISLRPNTFLPSIVKLNLMAWFSVVLDLKVNMAWAVRCPGFLCAIGLMYLALVISFSLKPALSSISVMQTGEFGSNATGMFSSRVWNVRSLIIKSCLKCVRNPLWFAGSLNQVADRWVSTSYNMPLCWSLCADRNAIPSGMDLPFFLRSSSASVAFVTS